MAGKVQPALQGYKRGPEDCRADAKVEICNTVRGRETIVKFAGSIPRLLGSPAESIVGIRNSCSKGPKAARTAAASGVAIHWSRHYAVTASGHRRAETSSVE